MQSSKIVNSYAVSPQATFTCPPCSIRYRRQGTEAPRRYTYCSVNTPKPQLLCFLEVSGTRASLREEIENTSIDLGHWPSPVVYVDTFPVPGEESDDASEHRLLVVHGDGFVTCFSQDLRKQEWSTYVNRDSRNQDLATSAQIQCAAIVSIGQARKTVLKSREDVLGMLGKGLDDPEGCLLLVVDRSIPKDMTGEEWTLTLRVSKISVVKSGNDVTSRLAPQKLQEIISMLIPEPHHLRSKQSKFTFHAAFGTLCQNSDGNLAVYQLSGSIPQLAHELNLASTMSSSLQLSPNLLACATQASFSIIDLPYCSVQVERILTDIDESSRKTQKPKTHNDQPTQGGNLELLSYFSPSDIVVAIQRRKLLILQLATAPLRTDGSRKRKRDGLLVNSISRGSSLVESKPSNGVASDRQLKPLGSYLPLLSKSPTWEAQRAELDRYSSKLEVENFEKAAARALGLEAKGGNNAALHPRNRQLLDLHKVYEVLSKIFSASETKRTRREPSAEAPRKLVMHFLPRRICGSLIHGGLFTIHHIERSLKYHGCLPFASNFSTGALIHALAEQDSSSELLSSMLASSTPLSSGELVHILAIITRGSDRLEVTESGRLLTNGDLTESSGSINGNGTQLTKGKPLENSTSPSPVFANNELHHRILSLTLKRLYTCPSSSVTRALKDELPTVQLRLLVDALRMEIARSGWLSPYDDNLEASERDYQDNNELCYIAHLLNCTIDSIGTGGWLLATSTSITDDLSETADTLAYMRAEISAALEGIEEATYMKGMLGEILLCGKNALQSSARPARLDQDQPAATPAKPMSIPLDEVDSSLLPLGLRTAPALSMTKVGAGGELIRRSARDIGRLKSKMVGKYSFDRIVI